MSHNSDLEPEAHFTTNAVKSPTKGILQKSYEYEAHETPEHKIKWDENKLQLTEKQKQQVQMKVNEPNTPFIRYDPVTNKVTNLEVLPESLRAAANEEPDDFDLGASHEGSGHVMLSLGNNDPDEWQKAEEKERRDEEEAARKRHEEFERKRAQHYYHAGDVMHQKLPDDED